MRIVVVVQNFVVSKKTAQICLGKKRVRERGLQNPVARKWIWWTLWTTSVLVRRMGRIDRSVRPRASLGPWASFVPSHVLGVYQLHPLQNDL